jgi:hypothetical protein
MWFVPDRSSRRKADLQPLPSYVGYKYSHHGPGCKHIDREQDGKDETIGDHVVTRAHAATSLAALLTII